MLAAISKTACIKDKGGNFLNTCTKGKSDLLLSGIDIYIKSVLQKFKSLNQFNKRQRVKGIGFVFNPNRN